MAISYETNYGTIPQQQQEQPVEVSLPPEVAAPVLQGWLWRRAKVSFEKGW